MKHLIVCLDGTWSDADRPDPETNIVTLSRLIDPRPEGGPAQRIYYDAGLGTGGGFLDRIAGGMFGKGLSGNVLAAYRFLSQFYAPGDYVYVFGFSRGAFTARSLCGFLSASGLLTADMCNPANLEFAWNYYRTPPKLRYPADSARLRRITHPEARIRFLGVFDTVGTLGIPALWLNRIGKRGFQFHDADVSSVVEHSCHALAIDEYRKEFEAAVWTEPRHNKHGPVEQVWFPGSHANIGGGYDDRGLSDLALEWMLMRLNRHCPELKLRPAEDWPRPLSPNYKGKLYDSRTWMFWRSWWRPLIRLINRCDVGRAWRCHLPEIRPNSRPIGEMVHWSALARWEETKAARRRRERYAPRNLLAVLKSVQESKTPVVGLDGEPTSLSGLYAGNGAQPTPGVEPPSPRAGNGAGLHIDGPRARGA